jgi:hypothetical protein
VLQTFERMLRCSIDPSSRHSDNSRRTTDIDNRAASPLTHMRHHMADDIQRRKEIHLHHTPGFSIRNVFNRAQNGGSSIVDKYINLSIDAKSFVEHVRQLGAADIELKPCAAQRFDFMNERGRLRGVAGGCDYFVAGVERKTSQADSKTAGAAGDEPHRHDTRK